MNPSFFSPRPDVSIAYHKTESDKAQGTAPGVIFLGGFRSNMTGTKAAYLEEQCRARGQSFLRMDYTGHGASSGVFEDGNIGTWAQDALDVFDALTTGPQIIVGSSMGGWIALLIARTRPDRIKGIVGLAAAPDFSEDILNHKMTAENHAQLKAQGYIDVPNEYGAPYKIYQQFFDDGKNHLVLQDSLPITAPVRLIHGKKDVDVPWQKSETIRDKLASTDVEIIYIEDGNHRLSRPEDLALIDAAVVELSRK